MTRFAIVDDHALLAGSLSFALQARGHRADVVPVTSLEQIRTQVVADPPEVVLLDLQLGEAGHALPLVRPLAESGARVLVVTGVTDPIELAATLEAGATAYVSKAEPVDVLLETALRVAEGTPVLRPERRFELLRELRRHREESRQLRAPFERLSAREKQVLAALCVGRSVTQIADDWVVAVPTVRTQVRSILTKLDTGSQLEAVAMAHRSGWFVPQPR